MNTVMLIVLAGMTVGAGVALWIAQAAPSHARLSDAVAHAAPSYSERLADPVPVGASRQERMGLWAERHAGRVPGATAPVQDLDLIGQTRAWFWGQKVSCALLGLVFPPLVAGMMAALGVTLPFVIPVLVSVGAAAWFWFLPDLDVKARAGRARREFAAMAVLYLRLVAIRRLGGRGVVESLESAAQVSDSWMFARIREELALAKMSGVTPWDALDRLGRSLRVPELSEIADITRLSQAGAGVSEQLMARAASMRDRLMSKEHTEAVKATTSLTLPTVVLVWLFMATLIYPMIVTLMA